MRMGLKIDMKHHKPFRYDLKGRIVLFLIVLFSSFFLAMSILTLSKFYSEGSFSMMGFYNQLNPNSDLEVRTADMRKMLDAILDKIADQTQDMKEKQSKANSNESSSYMERVRLMDFLADITGLVETVRNQLPAADGNTNGLGFRVPQIFEKHSLTGENTRGKLESDVHEFFLVEEIRKYITMKPNRLGKQNFMSANGTFTSIGHACFVMKDELEEYMDYDVGEICKDDWKQAQKLMVHGCDPLPRRRCFATAPKFYMKPLPVNESMWKLPDDRNVRWDHYRCKNFSCLAQNITRKGFFKCADCFNLTHHEWPRWMQPVYLDPSLNLTSDFLIEDVLSIKPGEIRIGLDFSAGTGTFAARMREFNVTIVTATINFGAPFSEMISLRGLIPLYITINQRLPFFDNTLDIIHTTRFLDGWIDFVLLDFVLYDWDRVLRPGGLLWIDDFFCHEKDLESYIEAFRMLRYKRHKWVIVPKLDKDNGEMFFSAVLEKPPRPF